MESFELALYFFLNLLSVLALLCTSQTYAGTYMATTEARGFGSHKAMFNPLFQCEIPAPSHEHIVANFIFGSLGRGPCELLPSLGVHGCH